MHCNLKIEYFEFTNINPFKFVTDLKENWGVFIFLPKTVGRGGEPKPLEYGKEATIVLQHCDYGST